MQKYSKEVYLLANQWGWKEPGENILEIAKLSIVLQTMKSGDALVYLGIVSREKKEELLGNKPNNIPTLRWIAQYADDVSVNVDKILTLQAGFPYLESINEIDIHEQFNQNHEIYGFCDKNDFVFITIENEVPAILFNSFDGLKDYLQRGKELQLLDPIVEYINSNDLDLRFVVTETANIGKIFQKTSQSGQVYLKEGVDTEDTWYAYKTKNNPVLKKVSRLLDESLSNDITDISIVPVREGFGDVFYRQFGEMTKPDTLRVLSQEELNEVTKFLLIKSGGNTDGTRLRSPADGQFIYKSNFSECYIRCSFIPIDCGRSDIDTVSISLRLLPKKEGHVELKKLNFKPELIDLIVKNILTSHGLMVVSGPTNSGKSTAVSGVLHEHFKLFGRTKKRISLEDPVERFLPDVLQINLSKSNQLGFAEAFKYLLRHDPDMVWIGEIRDSETAETCVRAASSGHFVVTTLHASDTIMTWKTLANMISKEKKLDLIESLNSLLAQRLIKRICPHCALDPRRLTDVEKRQFEHYCNVEKLQDVKMPDLVVQANINGCSRCKNGFSGVVPVHEILTMSREVKNLMLKDDVSYSELSKFRDYSLFQNALELLSENKIEINSIFI
jgi:type II secretory ATPase GspE/PulE/Tfp pilus assembly ATPase PilB-like protein